MTVLVVCGVVLGFPAAYVYGVWVGLRAGVERGRRAADAYWAQALV